MKKEFLGKGLKNNFLLALKEDTNRKKSLNMTAKKIIWLSKLLD